jgi:hypothetical protein
MDCQNLTNAFMFDLYCPHTPSRLFAPIWQSYPLTSEEFTAFNWDWLTDEDPDPLIQCIDKIRAIIGEPYILPDLYVV